VNGKFNLLPGDEIPPSPRMQTREMERRTMAEFFSGSASFKLILNHCIKKEGRLPALLKNFWCF